MNATPPEHVMMIGNVEIIVRQIMNNKKRGKMHVHYYLFYSDGFPWNFDKRQNIEQNDFRFIATEFVFFCLSRYLFIGVASRILLV